jgi:transposase
VGFAQFFDVLKKAITPLLPTWRRQAGKRPIVFIMDNAPTHGKVNLRPKVVTWLAKRGIEMFEMPPYSPDLNPIENAWWLLKYRERCKSTR